MKQFYQKYNIQYNQQKDSKKQMKEKLIITVWKAQLNQKLNKESIYCRLNYNNEFRNTKYLDNSKSLVWKQTFVFSLSKTQMPLRIDFISLDKGEAIHFAKDNVAQALSFGKAIATIPAKNSTKGSLPSKLDIFDQNQMSIGKLFIEYQILKTQVAYIVEKELDYIYLLKLSNFRVSFIRNLKRVPKFYLKLIYDGMVHKQQFEFEQDKGTFSYNYPIKLHMKKQMEMQIELQVKQYFGIDFNNASQSLRSQSFNQKKSESSIGKKNTIDLGNDKVSSTLQLTFTKNIKINKKIPLFIVQKQQKREIGSIQFVIQTTFKTQQQKMALQQQQNGVGSDNLEVKQQKNQKKRKANVQQGNGFITINAIMGRLELFNEDIISNKNISLIAKLGKQFVQSTILQNPGKELIFIDSFTFKRTWEQTIKFSIQIHKQSGIKMPAFYSSVNLRELFQVGRVKSKKVKVTDQNKNYCGQLSLDMQYKEEQKKMSKDTSLAVVQQLKPEQLYQKKMQQKRQKIAQRMKRREEEKKGLQTKSVDKGKQMITISQALQLKDLILPPLITKRRQNLNVNQSRYSTLSPKQKNRNGYTYNSNGGIKFTKSPRFIDPQKSPDSYLFIQDSQFNLRNKKKGAFIGYGGKHDFTKDHEVSPGVGKYSIPSVWDKYN